MQLKIIYEDKSILVCHKPAGIATQTAKLSGQDMVNNVKNYLARQTGNRSPYVGVVHRLDQPVSGLLVFAKTKQAAANLSKQLGEEGAHKEYLAYILGQLDEAQGILEHYLKKDPVSRLAQLTDAADPQGKQARLSYQVVQQEEACTLLSVCLETGRFHQIRAQMAAAGHPLLGDRKYGNPESERLSMEKGISSVALCARRLGFTHPVTAKEMDFRIGKEELPLWCKV